MAYKQKDNPFKKLSPLKNDGPSKKYKKIDDTDDTVTYRKTTVLGDKTKTYKKSPSGNLKLKKKEKYRTNSSNSKTSTTTKTKTYTDSGTVIKDKVNITTKKPSDRKLDKEKRKDTGTRYKDGQQRKNYRLSKASTANSSVKRIVEPEQYSDNLFDNTKTTRLKQGSRKQTLGKTTDTYVGSNNRVTKVTVKKPKIKRKIK